MMKFIIFKKSSLNKEIQNFSSRKIFVRTVHTFVIFKISHPRKIFVYTVLTFVIFKISNPVKYLYVLCTLL